MGLFTVKIDAKKLDKARFFQGKPDQTGHAPLWIDLVLIERRTPGKFGATHLVKQSASKEERANKVDLPIIGEATQRGQDGGKSHGAPAREGGTLGQKNPPQRLPDEPDF